MIEHQRMREMDISVYHTAKKGNWCSGDSFYTVRTDDYILCAVADGLGSGEEAMNASDEAMSVIKAEHSLDTEALMVKCNKVMWGTRGAVLTIVKFDFASDVIEYTNVGNISCTFYTPEGEIFRPVPVRGYLSGKRKKFRTERIPYEKNTVFLIYSDGLLFVPAFHKLFSKNARPEEMLHNLVNVMERSDDDTTILLGKVN